MDQESHNEPHDDPPPAETLDAAMATDDAGSAETAPSQSGSDADDSDDIVAEVRDLYTTGGKVDVLIRLVQSRTAEARLQRQIEVYQVAMEQAVAEKTRLQLDLAYYGKVLAVLERGAKEAKSAFVTVSQQHAEAIRMMEELDLKRTQFIKDEQLLKGELTEYKQKFVDMQREMQENTARFEADSRRSGQLQVQVDKLNKANEAWQKKVSDSEAKQQQMVSAHSAQLNELENLLAEMDGQLKEAQCRADSEKRTNAVLKEHTDSVLQEKTQLAMELTTVENRIAGMEAEFERKLAAVEARWQVTVKEETLMANEKMGELVRMGQELCAEKDLLLAKLAQQKDATTVTEGKLGGLKAILEDRNKEIFSLQSKLNCELKRFEDAKQQFSESSTEASKQLTEWQNRFAEQDSKITRLEEDLHNQLNTLSTFKSQLESKDVEIKQLKEKTPNVDHYLSKIKQLESALADQTSKVAQLEQQLERQTRSSADDKSTITAIGGTENITAQITSTPNHIELSDSGDELATLAAAAAKKPRVMTGTDQTAAASSPNYATFQGSVQRKRSTFFKRTTMTDVATEQVSVSSANNYQRIFSNMNLDMSSASTINVDDEALEIGTLSNVSTATSVRYVKPFFRRVQDKK